MNKIIRVDAPYPVVVAGENDFYQVKCIVDDYSGEKGELTAVTEYMYYAYICFNQNDMALAEMFEGIGIAEMMHHKLLGGAIAKFGGNPIIGGAHDYWTGANVQYTMSKKEMLENSINLEQIAIENYKKAIICTDNVSLKKLIERILADEYLHLEYFNKALRQVEQCSNGAK